MTAVKMMMMIIIIILVLILLLLLQVNHIAEKMTTSGTDVDMDSAKQQNKLSIQEQLKGRLVILMAMKDIKLGSTQTHNVMH